MRIVHEFAALERRTTIAGNEILVLKRPLTGYGTQGYRSDATKHKTLTIPAHLIVCVDFSCVLKRRAAPDNASNPYATIGHHVDH